MRKDFQLCRWNGRQNRPQQPQQTPWQSRRDQARDNSSSQSSRHQYQCFLCPSARHSSSCCCCCQAPQRPAGAELSSPRCRGSETIWRVTMLESLLWINEGYKLCHKVRLLRLCKWGPGVRKYSELLTLEQTTHISGGCMKIEVKETTVTFWAQKLADNNAFT